MTFTLFDFVIIILILLFSVIIHEVSHGYAALKMGDDTAEKLGRLTLNPLKHIDPIGSIFVPLFLGLMMVATGGGIIFGWAKPVPVNPLNFKDKKYSQAKVAFSGPASNLLVALIFGSIIRFVSFPPDLFYQNLVAAFSFIVWINILLAVFNLLPIPPLDGSHILFTFLPRSSRGFEIFLRRNGFLFLLIFIFFLFPLIIPIVGFIFRLFTGMQFV